MARVRAKAAVRKAAARALETERARSEPIVIGDRVRAVAVDLEPLVTPGALYWSAPNAFMAEEAAAKVCRAKGLPASREDDVAAYLHAALNEFFIALVGDFDVQHFEAWSAAQSVQIERGRVVSE